MKQNKHAYIHKNIIQNKQRVSYFLLTGLTSLWHQISAERYAACDKCLTLNYF